MDSLRSTDGTIYMIFYGRIQIPRISGNFGRQWVPGSPFPPAWVRGYVVARVSEVFYCVNTMEHSIYAHFG